MVKNFKDLKAIHTIYNKPWDFSFTRNDEEGIFYAYYLGTDERQVDAFWTIKTTPLLIKDAESHIIDLRTFLTTPHEREEVRIETGDGESIRLNLDIAMELYHESLPYPDIYLRTPEQ